MQFGIAFPNLKSSKHRGTTNCIIISAILIVFRIFEFFRLYKKAYSNSLYVQTKLQFQINLISNHVQTESSTTKLIDRNLLTYIFNEFFNLCIWSKSIQIKLPSSFLTLTKLNQHF